MAELSCQSFEAWRSGLRRTRCGLVVVFVHVHTCIDTVCWLQPLLTGDALLIIAVDSAGMYVRAVAGP